MLFIVSAAFTAIIRAIYKIKRSHKQTVTMHELNIHC